MAYMISKKGSDWKEIHVKHTETGEDISPGVVTWVKYSGISWFKNYGFFYSSFREPSDRPPMGEDAGTETTAVVNQILCFHRIGTLESEDIVVYRDKSQPKWFFTGAVSSDSKYLIISVREAGTKNLVYVSELPATGNEIAAMPRDGEGNIHVDKIMNEWEARYSYISSVGDEFTFKTNLDAPKNRVIRFNLGQPKAEWKTLIAETEHVL
jgi:prolyl oligopeptidase